MKISTAVFYANDPLNHRVRWVAKKKMWVLFNDDHASGVKECLHLCGALTAMHWRTASEKPLPEYLDILVRKWTIE